MEILYSSKAEKQLKKIAKGDKKSAQIIIDGIEDYSINHSKNHDIKILKGRFGHLKRLRIGNYRIIFDDEKIIHIYEIKHRQGVYND